MRESANPRILRTIPVLIVVCLASFPCYAKYGGGTGEPNDPYLISTAEDLNDIGAEPNDWDKHFILMADIDLSAYIGAAFNIIGTRSPLRPFTGVFGGNGHTISNFSYTSTDANDIGLFGYISGGNARVKDLGLIDPNIDAGNGNYVGSLAGWLEEGTITNCYVVGGSVSGNRIVGRFVGCNGVGTITNCYAQGGSVSGNSSVGGLVGYNWIGTITNCYDQGGSVSGNQSVGGLVGYNLGAISDCYATGSVTGWMQSVGGLCGGNGGTICNCYATVIVSGGIWLGGLCGENWGAISECCATGSVTGGMRYLGGLCGMNRSGGTISNCYATGSVIGGTHGLGGLCGYNLGTISECYATGSVTSWGSGGLVGLNSGEVKDSFWDIETSGQTTSNGGTGKTTPEMQDPNTFMKAGWNFVGQPDGPHDIWAEPVGGGYPILWWQLSPLPELPFSGGTGEPDEPYLISTANELNSIGHNLRLMAAHFKLTKDIDLAGIDFYIIGSDAYPFTGVFDGNGHTISNFSYTSTDTDYVGLFSYVEGENAEMRNLGLIDPNIDSGTGDCVGSLAGWLEEGTITNCYVVGGSVTGAGFRDYKDCIGIGGLVGKNNYGTITDCYASASVSGDESVGGLVGYNGVGTITNCHATACVAGGDYSSFLGGLVGYNDDGSIAMSYSTGSVNGTEYVGGLVGNHWGGRITASYSTGTVIGNEYVGGLAGSNYGNITTSYSTGTVNGNLTVGGLVGGESRYSGYSVIQCFWDIETSGQATSAGGTGLTTAEMQDIDTFLREGWDFVDEVLNGTCDYWQISLDDYPRLRYHFGDNPVMPEGLGTAQEPYLIRNARDLGTVWFKPLSYYRLEAPVDLSGITWSMAVVPWFGGTFDGNGYVISNLHIQGGEYLGLFGQSGSGAKVSDLCLEAVDVNGIGGCVGGIVGENMGRITTSYCTGTVTGSVRVGALAGWNSEGSIATSYSTGTVSGFGSVGGLAGNNGGSISKSYSTGMVNGMGDYVGGLAGYNWGSITTSYSTGTVIGNEDVGGLVGRNWWDSAVVSTCFWDTETSGLLNMCGTQEEDATGCDDSFGLTTAEMQTASTFLEVGWDFVDVWSICEGTNYPRFVWQIPLGDLVCPDGVTMLDFSLFAAHWLDDNCDPSNDYCQGTDLDLSGAVGADDLGAFADNWPWGR